MTGQKGVQMTSRLYNTKTVKAVFGLASEAILYQACSHTVDSVTTCEERAVMTTINSDADKDYQAKLNALRLEHRDLDEVISRLARENGVDDLQIKRLKRRKLMLKDQITLLESRSIPDLNA